MAFEKGYLHFWIIQNMPSKLPQLEEFATSHAKNDPMPSEGSPRELFWKIFQGFFSENFALFTFFTLCFCELNACISGKNSTTKAYNYSAKMMENGAFWLSRKLMSLVLWPCVADCSSASFRELPKYVSHSALASFSSFWDHTEIMKLCSGNRILSACVYEPCWLQAQGKWAVCLAGLNFSGRSLCCSGWTASSQHQQKWNRIGFGVHIPFLTHLHASLLNKTQTEVLLNQCGPKLSWKSQWRWRHNMGPLLIIWISLKQNQNKGTTLVK